MDLDHFSYDENVAKLMDLVANFGNAESIRALIRTTFSVRRNIIVEELKLKGYILKEMCPVFNQPDYVSMISFFSKLTTTHYLASLRA